MGGLQSQNELFGIDRIRDGVIALKWCCGTERLVRRSLERHCRKQGSKYKQDY